ncbi:MAG: hypothetical protein QOF84_7831 [Streptomyces sp.]|nr:hypothetical protein [Streptomyces sp.]
MSTAANRLAQSRGRHNCRVSAIWWAGYVTDAAAPAGRAP